MINMSFGMIFSGIIISLMFSCVYALGGILVVMLYWWLSDKMLTFIFRKNPELGENIWSALFTIVLIITIIAVLGFGIYRGFPEIAIETAKWEEPYNYTTHTIMNLADNNEIEGHIRGRYVRGYIGETTTYHYYYPQYDGGMKLQKVNEKNATIYFTDSEPRAEWYSQTRTFWWKSETRYFCKIYIPEGTMTTEFEIDMN